MLKKLFLFFLLFPYLYFAQSFNSSYPVILDNDTLFTISKGIGSVNAKNRAEHISNNLEKLLQIYANPDSIKIIDDGVFISIAYNDFIILAVTALDTIGTNRNVNILAENYRLKIRNALSIAIKKHALQNNLWGFAKFAGLIVVVFLIFWGIKFLYKNIYNFINSANFNYTLKIKNRTFLETKNIKDFLRLIFRLIRLLLTLLILYYFIQISLSLFSYTKEINLSNYLKPLFYIIFASALYFSILKLINSFFKLITDKINEWKSSIVASVNIKNIQFFSEERLIELTVLTQRLLKSAFIFIASYLYLAFIFSNFYFTAGFTDKLLAYLYNPFKGIINSFINYLPNIFTIIVIVLFIRYINKFLKFIFDEIGKGVIAFKGFLPEWAEPTYKIVRFLFIVFGAIVIFPYLPGSDSPVFQGFSVFLGILFSLGSSSAISNIVAGVVITYMNPFKVGDRVKIADTMGDIVEKSLLVTRIKTTKNVHITIPNSMILSSHIINFSTSKNSGLILHTTVTIGYDVPWKTVHDLLISAALNTEDILKEPAPFVLQTGLEDFYVSYELNAFTNNPNKMASIYSNLHQNIQDKFNEAGVEIMSPHYSAIRDGNKTTIPEDYLPKDYKTPGFNIPDLLNVFKDQQSKK